MVSEYRGREGEDRVTGNVRVRPTTAGGKVHAGVAGTALILSLKPHVFARVP